MILDTGLQLKKPNYSFEQSSSTISKNTIDYFCSYLFCVRNNLHILHLNTSSYAEHVALGDAYDGVLEIADSLVETAQTERLLTIEVPTHRVTTTPLNYIKEVLNWVREYRNVFPYSFQQNEIDTLELLLSKTIYKLTFLK